MTDYDPISNRETKELNFKPFENLSNTYRDPPGRRFLRRWLPPLVAGVAFSCLVVVSFFFWVEVSKRFPHLPAGVFTGELKGIVSGTQGGNAKFYVERSADKEELLFVVLEAGWPPQLVVPISSGTDSAAAGSFLPVTLQGPESTRIVLSGAQNAAGSYEGSAENITTGAKGKWSLRDLKPQDLPPLSALQDLKLRLMLKAELKDVESRISQSSETFPRQKAEIENLTSVVAEGDKLKSRANEKYNAVMNELSRVSKILSAKSEETRKLEAAFSVSQRVTGMGKLASLSRESLEREWRWVDSMMRSQQSESNSEDLGAAVERGQKILDLKREIAIEEERINQLIQERADPTDPDAGQAFYEDAR